VLFSVVSCQPQTAAERRVVRAVAVEAAALIGEGAERARLFFFYFLHPSARFSSLVFSREGSSLEKGRDFSSRLGCALFAAFPNAFPTKDGFGSSVMNSPFKSWNYHLKLERLGLWSPAL
jgi:hypothetical protein